jgi:hypothetical protein
VDRRAGVSGSAAAYFGSASEHSRKGRSHISPSGFTSPRYERDTARELENPRYLQGILLVGPVGFEPTTSCRSRFVGRLGDDPRGDGIVTAMEAAGVEVATERIPGVPSPVSSVLLTPDGERTIVNHTDPRLFSTPPSVGASASQAAQVRATSLRATAVVA